MKKIKYILLCCLIACTTMVHAQQEEPVLMTVSYEFKHVYDTNNRDKPYTKEMVLHLGQTNSKYQDGEAYRRMKEMKKAEQSATAVAMPMRVAVGKPMAIVQSIPTEMLFQMPQEKKIICASSIGMGQYLYPIAMPAIKWKIESETRQIDQYHCQKATGVFAGRTYTAWFTTELPFRNGPWKLCGLPGLILEAKDANDEVAFTFKEISKGDSGELIKQDLRRPVTVDEKTFLKAKRMFAEDPSDAMASQLPNYTEPIKSGYRSPSGKMLYGEEAKAAMQNEKKILNNPMERGTQ